MNALRFIGTSEPSQLLPLFKKGYYLDWESDAVLLGDNGIAELSMTQLDPLRKQIKGFWYALLGNSENPAAFMRNCFMLGITPIVVPKVVRLKDYTMLAIPGIYKKTVWDSGDTYSDFTEKNLNFYKKDLIGFTEDLLQYHGGEIDIIASHQGSSSGLPKSRAYLGNRQITKILAQYVPKLHVFNHQKIGTRKVLKFTKTVSTVQKILYPQLSSGSTASNTYTLSPTVCLGVPKLDSFLINILTVSSKGGI